jgi:hypothetical protein
MGKKRLLRIVTMGLAAWLSVSAGLVPTVSAQTNGIPVILDGKELSFDVPPSIIQDRVVVPVRAILEALGAHVAWDGSTRTVYANKGKLDLKIPIGSLTVYKNGIPIHLDVPAVIIQGRTLVPVRFVSEALGEKVSWENRSVLIQTPAAFGTTGNPTPAPDIRVVAADKAVTHDQIQHVQAILNGAHVIEELQQDLGRTFQSPVTIHVAQDVNGYRSALLSAGLSMSDVNSVADGSNGVAIGEDVYFPLSENKTDDQLRNILGHELTHVLLNESGIGDLVPSWINEGIAWKEGLAMEYANTPDVVYKGQIAYMYETILDAFGTTDWQPLLGDAEATIHSTNAYNVEWQDYFAVDLLQKTYGWNAILTYLNQLSSNPENTAFQQTFGTSESRFEQTFNQTLSSQKHQSDKGMLIKINVSSAFQGVLEVMPKNSNVWSIYHVNPGTYTIQVSPDGTISGLPGQPSQQTTKDPLDPNTVFIGILPDRPTVENGKTLDHAGMALATKYGQSYFLNAWTVDTFGNSSFDANPNHLGVELLDVRPVS